MGTGANMSRPIHHGLFTGENAPIAEKTRPLRATVGRASFGPDHEHDQPTQLARHDGEI